ncbi:MAG: cation diffusion facilitator family transporter [Blautia obeum]
MLFFGKWLAGTISGSIAITADAFNNLSDAGSSIITLIGFRLSGQEPDPEHPFGHGRMEYISGLLVSVAILVMGFELIGSSIGKLRSPEPIESSALVFSILIHRFL